MPWSPLAGGFLTGKYRRGDAGNAVEGAGRLSGANPFGDTKFMPRNWDILDVLLGVAQEVDRPAPQVALAWAMARPGVTSTIVGARDADQLRGNLAATDLTLTPAQMARLTEASAPAMGFSASLTQPAMRRMVFGGNDVTGWGD